MKKYFPNVVRFVLIIMLLAGAFMCVTWIPRAVSYLESVCQPLYGKTALIYSGFCLTAIPLFAICFMAFAFVPAFEQDSIFDKRIARLIKRIGCILLCDCLLFGGLTGVIVAMGEFLLSVLFVFISLIGLTVSVVLLILADHVSRASELKEEVEGTL